MPASARSPSLPARRRLTAAALLVGLGLAAARPAGAAEPVRVLVISALGDDIDVVQHAAEVGSHLDRNHHQRVPLPGAGFDTVAGQATAQALQRIEGVTVADLLAVARAPDAPPWIDSGRFAPDEVLAKAISASSPGQLVLLTPWRTQANLQLQQLSVGSGKLEGLGFYIDRQIRVRRHDTGERGVGMLAPFAYFKLTLIDAASGQVLREETVQGSRSLSAARAPDGLDPWQALKPEQKIKALHRLIHDGVTRAVPVLMLPPR